MMSRDSTSARRIKALIEAVLAEEHARESILRERFKHLLDEERDTLIDLHRNEDF